MFLPIILSPWEQCCVRAFLYRARGRTTQHGLSHMGSRLSVTDHTNTGEHVVSCDQSVVGRWTVSVLMKPPLTSESPHGRVIEALGLFAVYPLPKGLIQSLWST